MNQITENFQPPGVRVNNFTKVQLFVFVYKYQKINDDSKYKFVKPRENSLGTALWI